MARRIFPRCFKERIFQGPRSGPRSRLRIASLASICAADSHLAMCAGELSLPFFGPSGSGGAAQGPRSAVRSLRRTFAVASIFVPPPGAALRLLLMRACTASAFASAAGVRRFDDDDLGEKRSGASACALIQSLQRK